LAKVIVNYNINVWLGLLALIYSLVVGAWLPVLGPPRRCRVPRRGWSRHYHLVGAEGCISVLTERKAPDGATRTKGLTAP